MYRHNYIGHNYTGRNCICHNHIGHNHICSVLPNVSNPAFACHVCTHVCTHDYAHVHTHVRTHVGAPAQPPLFLPPCASTVRSRLNCRLGSASRSVVGLFGFGVGGWSAAAVDIRKVKVKNIPKGKGKKYSTSER